MAVQISEYCWATAKCGMSTAYKYFQYKYNSKKDVWVFGEDEVDSQWAPSEDFLFVIVRNPYRRIVSFYISKLINKHGPGPGKNKIPRFEPGDLNCTFEEMVPLIDPNGDQHLKLQSTDAPKNTHFVRLEYWAEDMKLVCDKLDLDYDKYKSVAVNCSPTIDTITEYVGDKPVSWFEENGTPSDYSLFYNNQTKKKIRDLYHVDFDWLSDVYDDIENELACAGGGCEII